MERPKHTIVRHPSSRLATIDLGQIGRKKHHMVALLELDVTVALAHLRERKAAGQSISFFAWAVKAISATIAEHRSVAALRYGKNSTVVFEDIDISVLVERDVDGVAVPLPLLIKSTNTKTDEGIHAEILVAKQQRVANEGDYVLSQERKSRRAMRAFYALPHWLRVALLRLVMSNPFRSKETMGTAVITSVGSIAKLPGFIIPKAMHNLCFAIGSIVKKPWVVAEHIEARDILHLTVLFDHDVVDGAPAARFIRALASSFERQPAAVQRAHPGSE